MADNQQVITTGFPVLGLLGTVLIVLKALHKIDCPWLWILAPFWGPWALLCAFLFVGLIIFLIFVGIAAIAKLVIK